MNRKPHNIDAGYIASRRHPTIQGTPGERGEGWVVIYEAEEQGIDVGDFRYAVVCNSHGTICAESSMTGARKSMKNPANFCSGCRSAEDFELLDREDLELLDRYAERCQYGWIVDPDGRRELYRDAHRALLEIDWLLEATDLESEYPAK